jgi:hypothetical protein
MVARAAQAVALRVSAPDRKSAVALEIFFIIT